MLLEQPHRLILKPAPCQVYKQRAADRPDQGIIHGGGAVQACKAEVGDGALLVVLPDPVMCFRDAKFRQVGMFGHDIHVVSYFPQLVTIPAKIYCRLADQPPP